MLWNTGGAATVSCAIACIRLIIISSLRDFSEPTQFSNDPFYQFLAFPNIDQCCTASASSALPTVFFECGLKGSLNVQCESCYKFSNLADHDIHRRDSNYQNTPPIPYKVPQGWQVDNRMQAIAQLTEHNKNGLKPRMGWDHLLPGTKVSSGSHHQFSLLKELRRFTAYASHSL